MNHKPCNDCQTPTPYEEAIIGGIDYMSLMPHLCETCNQARQATQQEQAKAKKIEDAKARYLKTVPPKLIDTDITRPEYNLSAHKAVMHAYAMDERANILLYGTAGRCKSRILARLCARASFEGCGIEWITAHDFALLAEQYKNFRTREGAWKQIERLKHISRLVFDDLGKHDWTNKIEEVFFAVIDYRSSHYLPTWFSANTNPEEMLTSGQLTKDRGASIVGRIIEGAHQFEFKP